VKGSGNGHNRQHMATPATFVAVVAVVATASEWDLRRSILRELRVFVALPVNSPLFWQGHFAQGGECARGPDFPNSKQAADTNWAVSLDATFCRNLA
jgi:hypothetical protein